MILKGILPDAWIRMLWSSMITDISNQVKCAMHPTLPATCKLLIRPQLSSLETSNLNLYLNFKFELVEIAGTTMIDADSILALPTYDGNMETKLSRGNLVEFDLETVSWYQVPTWPYTYKLYSPKAAFDCCIICLAVDLHAFLWFNYGTVARVCLLFWNLRWIRSKLLGLIVSCLSLFSYWMVHSRLINNLSIIGRESYA